MKHHHLRRLAHHVRNKKIITRRKFLTVASLLNVVFLTSIAIHVLSFPNTYVGTIPVGLRTKKQIGKLLQKTYNTPIPLVINAQQYALTYEHIGIYMDENRALDKIFAPNSLPFPKNIAYSFLQLFKKRDVVIPLIFTQEFYEYVKKVSEAGLFGEDIVYINQFDKQATLYASNRRYTILPEQFEQLLIRHFGTNNTPLIVPLSERTNDLEQKVAETNKKLAVVYADPLTVIVGINGQNTFITLSPDDLKRYTTVRLSETNGTIEIATNAEVFLDDLATALSVFATSFNPNTAYERVSSGIRNALATRYAGGPADSVKVGIDSGPNTDGAIGPHYIEIDISQQKLFTFKNGALAHTYRVSTGKDYPTPVGTFKILNKTGLGFSRIYNVWMPYWMGFEFSKELHAYFGIHELPYYYTGDQKIQRPREFIGAPNTGGCVALDVGDAKEVYQFADIGTPVVIYE